MSIPLDKKIYHKKDKINLMLAFSPRSREKS